MERPSTADALTRLRTPYIAALTKPALLERFEQMCRERPDVEAIRCIFNNNAHEWIHSVGVCSDAQLQELVPPIPPRELRAISSAPEREIFLWTGLVDLTAFLAIYHYHTAGAVRPKVLDFGAGSGRLIRFLADHTDAYEPYASDVNADHVAWCAEHLKGVTTFQNDAGPPLAAAATQFDLIYSLSVFTHLSERSAAAWLEELHARLAPGGILIFTTHGAQALHTIASSAVHEDMFRMTAERAIEINRNLDRDGFVFLKYSADTLHAARAGNEYGNAFIHPAYIRTRYGTLFEQLECIPAGLRGWQDVFVMRRHA